MNELDRLEQISRSVENTASNLRGISGDLRPYRNLVRVLFVFCFSSLLMLGISVYFGISVYITSVKSKTEIIYDYEDRLKGSGKTIVPEKQLNEFKDYYEYFLHLDDVKNADARKTLKNVKKSIEKWHKEREKQR